MKVDKHLPAVALTRNQSFFVGCWFNMVHEHSLDSFRVAAMNPRNVLRELSRLFGPLGKSDERTMVRQEGRQVLTKDVVLAHPPFDIATAHLLKLLDDKGPLSGKEAGDATAHLSYFIAELESLIEAHYVESCLAELYRLLCPTDATNLAPDQFEQIYRVTSHLLSTLVDKKASLESLYAIYSQVLVPRGSREDRPFQRRFELCCKLLTQQPSHHQVVLALDNVTAPHEFPSRMGGVTFSTDEPPIRVNDGDKSGRAARARRYLEPANRRVFACLDLEAQDPRAAGAEAAEIVSDILNLVRFEYERSRITLPVDFAYAVAGKAEHGARLLPLPVVVPNPWTAVDAAALSEFVQSVDELMSRGAFQKDGRDRVKSAFRFYRMGLDSDVLENKLVNWWTALEYLVRGNTQSGGIGKAVEDMLPPVLCRTYIAKFVAAFRAALIDAAVVLTRADEQEPIALKALTLAETLDLFSDATVQAQVRDALSAHVFFQVRMSEFFANIAEPGRICDLIVKHEQRLRWQLQRLWRARCDVVHSAERSVSAALLCANLEYYLKSALTGLLRALRDVPTLSGPKEFFDRQAMSHDALKADLRGGSRSELRRTLMV